jgi:hypothetical protein
VISRHFREHLPPHFHAEYGEDEATIGIRALTVLNGALSSRSLGMVIEWASQHQSELLDLWERAQRVCRGVVECGGVEGEAVRGET